MGWRNVIVASRAKLSLRQNHLVVSQKEDIEIPLEDISVVVVETKEALITSSLLDALASRNIPLFACGQSHIPTGVLLSYQGHSRFLKVLKSQMEQTAPFRKNCWRLIVRQKILNQANCLEILGKQGADELRSLASDVRSGDKDNRESTAARIYFESYMPQISRREDNCVNHSLNYGYSIMRGAVARSLTSYGFLCAVGVHHRNELNSFNLADDFMETLRPLVDLWTAFNIKDGQIFSVKERQALVGLLTSRVAIDGVNQNVDRAIDIMSASFGSATAAADPELLKLPAINEWARQQD